MLTEAKQLNFEYGAIKKIASIFHNTNIQEVFNLEEILKPMGAKIICMSPLDFEKSNNFFKAYGENNFEISTVDQSDNKFKRVLLAQGLGHYVLHSQRGKYPCMVSKISGSIAAKEGFYFSLALLLPDEIMVRIIKDGFTNEQISNMFRVPKKIVEIKKLILTKGLENF